MKRFLFEYLMVNVQTNRFDHKLNLNNSREFFYRIYDKFHDEQFHHDRNLHMNL
jgi:hypothetical protein